MKVKAARVFLTLFIDIALAPAAFAQTPVKVPRIGYLTQAPLSDTPSPERAAFLKGLRELGYIEGKTIVIEYRSAEANVEMLPEAAAELVEAKVDLIVVAGTVPGLAAKQATRTIPVVFTAASDPVANGLVASLAKPGGNVTGLSTVQPELAGKKLQLLKDTLPKLSRVAVLWTSAHPAHALELKEAERAAPVLGIKLQLLDVTRYSDLERAFSMMSRDPPDAVLTFFDYRTLAYRSFIAEFAAKNRIPSIFASQVFVEAGGLMSYGPNAAESFHGAASYVDKILKGTKPGDLPVQQPSQFELVVNLKTARTLGLTIPESILLRAHKVIE
jgi:putative tryptophan/tyrosine transport system substrate-binding protein